MGTGAGAMIRVLLAEDQGMMRGALALLLGLEPDIEVVAQVGAGSEVVPEALRTRPDVSTGWPPRSAGSSPARRWSTRGLPRRRWPPGPTRSPTGNATCCGRPP